MNHFPARGGPVPKTALKIQEQRTARSRIRVSSLLRQPPRYIGSRPAVARSQSIRLPLL
jgi:hypothetical protein